MNRVSLLHILDHATTLAADDVRELEQLAQAFPYCQTAHLLLAKAAHDQGTMLAGQRLRRAATYAADRALLRQLIEAVPEAQPPVVAGAGAVGTGIVTDTVEESLSIVSADDSPVVGASTVPTVEVPVAVAIPVSVEATVTADAKIETNEPAATVPALVMPAVSAPALGLSEPVVPLLAAAPAVAAGLVAPPQILSPTLAAKAPEVIDTLVAPVIAPVAKTPTSAVEPVAVPPEIELPVTAPNDLKPTVPAIAATVRAIAVGNQPSLVTEAPVSAATATVASAQSGDYESVTIAETSVEQATSFESPATALPNADVADAELIAIETTNPVAAEAAESPAVEVAAAEVSPAFPADEVTADELPAIAPPVRPPAEARTARAEFGLGEDAPAAPAYLLPGLSDEWTWPLPPKPTPEPVLTAAAFTGDAALGYGWGEGSRLGWTLLPLAASEVAAAPLPLLGEFFPPDALLLAHWADHRPAAPPAPSALDLIDTFLRQKPRLSRPTLHKATTEVLADLSTPSTRPEPELASETLARILARQGKLTRAIEIYERLMVKQPEKMAYFAAEIQQLQLQQPPLP